VLHARPTDLTRLSGQVDRSSSNPVVVVSPTMSPRHVHMMKQKRIILLAEDDADLRGMFRVALVLDGFHGREAADGYEALRMLEQGGTDLVVLDLRLPRINGFTEASKYLACGRAAAKCCDESTDDVIDPYEHWTWNSAVDAR
jgi:PleD family two-component response regulator